MNKKNCVKIAEIARRGPEMLLNISGYLHALASTAAAAAAGLLIATTKT